MTAPSLPVPTLDLPVPARVPEPPLDTIVSGSAEAFRGVFSLDGAVTDSYGLRRGIARAEEFLASCAAQAAVLREAMEPMPVDVLAREIMTFGAAL